MSIFDKFTNKTISRVDLVTERGNGFFAWNGKAYQSDIVLSAIRQDVKAVGKLTPKHVRESFTADGKRKIDINPEPYIRFLLEEPNPWMTGSVFREKLMTQLKLNQNAFALILRDDNGMPINIYPISASGCEAIYDRSGELFLKFFFNNGKIFTFRYTDVIHLRDNFHKDDIFGTPIFPALEPLMQIVSVTDQGIVKAVKNSSVIRWLLKLNSSMRKKDVEEQANSFAKAFLDVENGRGVAAVDAKADAVQVNPTDYVPNAAQMDRTTKRIYSLFGTNQKVVDTSRSEAEWGAHFDSEVEWVQNQLSEEFTRKLFSRKARAFGNKIVFEASAWDCASMQTKLNLVSLVDRGALTPNEWRAAFNLAPVDGGDEPIRRLDTAPTKQIGEEASSGEN